MKVLLFPIEFYPFEIFTRATPGSSLVMNICFTDLQKKLVFAFGELC